MTDEDREIIDTIERWAERELRPIARKFDHADEYPTEIVAQMKELGLFGATIAPEYGGLGLGAVQRHQQRPVGEQTVAAEVLSLQDIGREGPDRALLFEGGLHGLERRQLDGVGFVLLRPIQPALGDLVQILVVDPQMNG